MKGQYKKVKITYNGVSKMVPETYVKGLKGNDLKRQIKSILEGKDRPRNTKFDSKRSKWVIKFENKYNKKITNKKFIHDNILTHKGQELIKRKGVGAYYSSGSRPGQTGQSWALARLASVIMGGPARRVDKTIWDEFKRS